MKRIMLITWASVTIALAGLLVAILSPRPDLESESSLAPIEYTDKEGDQELAYLLVKLVLGTRATMLGHYARAQSPVPAVDLIYKRWLAKNTILPAAVADRIFAEIVPGATGGRAWVKMVVEEPRNPHNRGDNTALELLHQIQAGAPSAERSVPEAYYYAAPIKANKTCLLCHGEPKGEQDPVFPQFKKNGWRAGEIIGAVIARVAPEK